ncbi:MAG TPA: glutamyl-tRNA reductase [Longimicrobiales bacterium]
MSLIVVGLSHHSAPVGVRERFVFEPEAAASALKALTASGAAAEAVVLSTCNRTEFYVVARRERDGGGAANGASRVGRGRDGLPSGPGRPGGAVDPNDAAPAVQAVLRLFAERAGTTPAQASEYIYAHRGRRAVEHLFRVVTSLDSMILGEAQIQGQVRAAYQDAAALDAEPKVVGPVLSRLFQTALAVGGRVRSETTLGAGAASIPAAAVELAKKIFGPLRGRRALVLGAGEMSGLALECLAAEGIRSVVVANRTEARARELAGRFGGRAARFDALGAALAETDIVVAATAAPHAVLTRDLFDRALPRGPKRPLLIVDIAIPRDVEPAVAEVSNVFLYDIDDLRQIVDDNLERRRAEIPVAERIVAEAVDDFWSWYAALDVVPVIRELRDSAEALRRSEVEKALRKLRHLTPADQAVVDQLTRQILNKVLHRPTVRLRQAAGVSGGASVVHAARYLFELGGEPTETDNVEGE